MLEKRKRVVPLKKKVNGSWSKARRLCESKEACIATRDACEWYGTSMYSNIKAYEKMGVYEKRVCEKNECVWKKWVCMKKSVCLWKKSMYIENKLRGKRASYRLQSVLLVPALLEGTKTFGAHTPAILFHNSASYLVYTGWETRRDRNKRQKQSVGRTDGCRRKSCWSQTGAGAGKAIKVDSKHVSLPGVWCLLD